MHLRKIFFGLMMIALGLCLVRCVKDDTYLNYTSTAGKFDGNILEFLKSKPGLYDSVLLVIQRLPGMVDSLSSTGVTFFAPGNRSFDIALANVNLARKSRIPALPPLSYSTMDLKVLDTFFCRYVISKKIASKDISGFGDGKAFPTLKYGYSMNMRLDPTAAHGYIAGGPQQVIYSDRKESIFTRNWINTNTSTVDIETKNGIVHLLASGHDFGFGKEFVNGLKN